MSLQLIVGGYDLTAFYQPKSLTIQDYPGGEVGKASFTLEGPYVSNDPNTPMIPNPMYAPSANIEMQDPNHTVSPKRFRPGGGMLVAVRDTEDPPGKNIFTGVLLRSPEEPKATDRDNDYHYTYKLSAASAGYTLDHRLVTDIWEDKQTGFIFVDVVRRFAPDFDLSNVATSGPNAGRFLRPVYIAERRKPRDVLDDLAASEGWIWSIEETEPFTPHATKTIKLGPPNKRLEEFSISDANVDDILTEMLAIDKGDLSQVRNIIHYNFFSEYKTTYSGVGALDDPLAYDKGLARLEQNEALIQPLGEANWAAYIKPGAVFFIPGSNFRYTVAQVFTNGNVLLSSPILDESGDVPYTFSNVPAYVKLRDQASIKALKLLFQNGDPGEREFEVHANQLMTFEQALVQARAALNEKSNPMIRMSMKTNTYLLRRDADRTIDNLGVSGGKVIYPKAGRAVRFELRKRGVLGTLEEKEITWKDIGAEDQDYRQLYELTISFSDRLFAFTTIFRKLIDGKLNGFGNNSDQVVFDAIDLVEHLPIGGFVDPDNLPVSARNAGDDGFFVTSARHPLLGVMKQEVAIIETDNPFLREVLGIDDRFVLSTSVDVDLVETITISDTLVVDDLDEPLHFRWVDGANPVSERAKWGVAQWTDRP